MLEEFMELLCLLCDLLNVLDLGLHKPKSVMTLGDLI